MTNDTHRLQDLLPQIILILNQAGRRDDIEVHSIHVNVMNGIAVFTDTAGQREHLANILGLPGKVYTGRSSEKFQYRKSESMGIRVYGGREER